MEGELVIAPQFDEAYVFNDGMAVVGGEGEFSGKWCYINRNGEYIIDGYEKTYNTYIDNLTALERLEEIINNSNLKPREREFITIFCGASARKVENLAHIDYFNNHFENAVKHNNIKQFYELISKYSYGQRLKYCCKRIGVNTPSAQSNFIKRILERLRKVKEQLERIDLIKNDFKFFDYLMTTNRSNTVIDHTARIDLLKFTNNAPTHRYNVIKWSTSEVEPQPITAEEQEQAQAQETARAKRVKILSKTLEIFKSLRDSEKFNNNGTYSAKFSAFTFFDKLTEEQQNEVATAELEAEAESKKKLKAYRNFNFLNFEEWRKLTATEKEEYSKKVNEFFTNQNN